MLKEENELEFYKFTNHIQFPWVGQPQMRISDSKQREPGESDVRRVDYMWGIKI